MKSIINAGVYQVDLQGSLDSEFCGRHPSIIVRTLYEENIYYIIPLTTYTKEKWERLRRYGCCKILSVNSIARIDKIQIRNKTNIPKRWLKEYKLIIPTYEETINVFRKMRESFTLAFDKCEKEYMKYNTQYNDFSDNCCKLFNGLLHESGFVTDNIDSGIFTYPLSCVNFLSFEDVKNILYQYIDLQSDKLLTIKCKYDTMNCIEG